MVGLQLNPEKTKYVVISRYQKSGQKHCIKIANMSFENVAKFKYLRTTLTDQNYKHEEIKNRLIRGTLAAIQFRVFCLPVWCLGT
jgi:hypothetical protein